MTTPSNEIVITESAMQKVLANDENLRLKCIVESFHEKVFSVMDQKDPHLAHMP